MPQNTAIQDVMAERRRQIEVEGFSPENDDNYLAGELAQAAACYALTCLGSNYVMNVHADTFRMRLWPWDISWWKPGDRRRAYVKAAALLLAEIERLDRLSLTRNGGLSDG